MPDKPGIFLRGGSKDSFIEPGNEIGDRELVIATDTGELGTQSGWINPLKLGGKVKNIYYAQTPAERQDIYSDTPQIINGLSLTITPETERSTFIVAASITGTFTYVAALLIYKDGVSIYNHTGNNCQNGAIRTRYDGSNDYNRIAGETINGIIETNSTDTFTVDIRATSSWGTGVYHFYVNDRNSNDMRSISTMVVYEVERDS